MKEKKKKGKHSLLVNILVFNIISIVITSFLYQGLIYRLVENSWKDTYLKYNESNINLTLSNVDREIIQDVVSIPSMYFLDIPSNASLIKPVSEDIGDNYEEIIDMVNCLEIIQKNYPDIYSLDVYYPLSNTIVTGFRSLHLDVNESKRDQLIPWYERVIGQDVDSQILAANQLNYPEHKEAITYVTGIPRYGIHANEAVAAIHIDVNSFSAYLDSQYGMLLILSDSGEVLYDAGNFGKTDMISPMQEQIARLDVTQGSESFYIQTGKDRMTAVAKHSTILDFTYVYILPMQGFNNDFACIKNLLIWMSAIFILIHIGVIVWISKRSNQIYANRIERVFLKSGIDTNGKRGTVDDSIEKLAVHITSLNSEIENSKPLILQNVVRALLFGQRKEGAETLLVLPEDMVRVFTVVIDIRQSGFNNNTALAETLNRQMSESPAGYYFSFSSIEKEKIAVLVCCNENGQEENLNMLREFLILVLDESMHYTLTWGREYELNETGISNSFKDTMQIYKYHFIFPEKEELSNRDIDLEKVKTVGSHLKIITQIERGLVGNDLTEAETKITCLMSALKSGMYSMEYCMSTLRDLIAMLSRLIHSADFNMLVIFGYDIRDYFNQILDIVMFEEWVIYLCRTFVENKKREKKNGETVLTEAISTFVMTNIENDISLEMLASHLNLRADTLSKMFKSTMGKSYSGYIRDIKMEYALDLLLNTDATVREVAEKIGYNSIQYFIKTFKSTYGDTPHQYKKQQQQK